MNKKRKEIENLIFTTFSKLDKTGTNTKYYKDFFSKMSDAQFDKYMKKFLNSDDNFYLEIDPYERDLSMDDIEDAAKFLGVELYEYVVLPYANPNGDPIVTQHPVPVGWIHMKRVQQTVAKKNSMSIHTDSRQGKTGQVVGDDKNSRMSDMENISLITMGATNTMKEFTHAKADNMKAKAEMANCIKRDGFVSMKDVSTNASDKVALNTLDVFFTSAGLKTNIITDGLLLNRTNKNLNKDVSSIGSKYIGKE